MGRTHISTSLLAAAILTTGCKSLEKGATETFAHEHSCPEDRVEARERPDVSGSSLVVGPPPAATPPPEVKSDPGRLAKWKADQEAEQQGARDVYDAFTVFEVNGCGHREFYACKRVAKVQGNANPIGCVTGKHPPP